MDCNVLKPLPEFSQLPSLHYLELEREMSSIHSQCDDCLSGQHQHTTEVYPDIPAERGGGGSTSSASKKDNKNPLVWGDDILFLDQRNTLTAVDGRTVEVNCSPGDRSDQDENKLALQRQIGQDNNNRHIELTVTNMVSLSELSEMGVMDSDKYISLPGFSFFPKDEEVEDLNDICNSLQLGSMVEAQPCTVEEIQQQQHHQPATPAGDEQPPSGRAGLRRTRNASRRISTISHMSDDTMFAGGGHSEALTTATTPSTGARKRNMSEHSLMSTGSYDDPDSPYHANGRRKRRRYEEEPSDDPAFEKSRKNAIIAKRNREKKKQLMEQMEERCDKLSAHNEQLDTDNTKLRHRVQTLEEEVFYLKSVLANQSALANVLSTMKNVDQVRFSSSFEASKYAKKSATQRPSNSPSASAQLKVSGGICLHVDGNSVSMEMCAKCAQMACGSTRSNESMVKMATAKRSA